MGASTPQRFRLSDAMILVMATAVGLMFIVQGFVPWEMAIPGEVSFSAIIVAAKKWHDGLSSLVAAWTVALLTLRLRRPRPRFRRLARQTGFVCTLVATAVLTIVFIAGLALVIRSGIHRAANRETLVSGCLEMWQFLAKEQVGCAVAGSWITLAAVGRWRPERDWIDRMGRALGAYWIAGPCIDLPIKFWYQYFFGG
jgi:hypothetical protein